MRKTLHSFLVGAILAFSPLFCWAQAQRTDAKPAAVERTIGGIPVGAKKVDVKKTFPLLSQYLTAGKSTSVFDRTLQGQAPKTMKAAAPSVCSPCLTAKSCGASWLTSLIGLPMPPTTVSTV